MNGSSGYRNSLEAWAMPVMGEVVGAASLVTGAATAVEVKASQYLRQPKIKHMDDMVTPMLQRERERDILLIEPAPVMPVMAEVVLQEMGREGMGRERDRDRDSRDSRDSHREARLERQHSSEVLMIQARRDELPQEVWRERAERKERKLERQTSSEQEGHGHEGRRKDRHRTERQESSEHDTAKEQSDRRSTEKRSGGQTLFDIVEQLKDREAATARGEVPKVPNGVPEKSSGRPDRPRARDRPKPRRRPRPKDHSAGEATTRRSRSAPEPGMAQSVSPSVLQPPSHTAHHEGFLFRKLDIETMKKSSNSRSWVNLYCVLNKGEIGFYKDAKNTATPYNNEPMLNLGHCHCDVTLGYKKKKNVFTLKTKDGSEFLFHAKDEDDLKAWTTNINKSIAEHEEIAKWGQPQPTTSSTDEGTRRDGSKADNKSDRGERPERAERSERSDKGETKSDTKRSEKTIILCCFLFVFLLIHFAFILFWAFLTFWIFFSTKL
ncbi:unnamed protein product [Oncorhynchus mykiss]|uniref:PH domain-containing protein n=1 Tax=Oncorhynchus mykiss TaxID=8022 RepID=A0A060WEC2_ONCMY|nr:unnamed protein product [Oncorhynchus mykiss]